MLIFIDLETTGVLESDKICSIAVIYEEKYIYELINEGKKIPAQASSIHHITNEDIREKGVFKESSVYKFLQKNNTAENTLVAHNIQFDLDKLLSHGFVWEGRVIDTLRTTKHLIPECELFGLQVLRYELQLYREESGLKERLGIKDALVAHNALSDALHVKLLFEYLEEMVDEEKMRELSLKNVLLEKFSFGKHNGKYIEDVCFNDRSYVEWLLSSAKELDEDMRYSLNYYLQG